MEKTLMEMSADIIIAQVSQKAMSPEEISESISKVFEALRDLQLRGDSSKNGGIVSKDPYASIQRNQVICLECSRAFKLLSNRHLALHGLTPRAYKQKHGIRMTQALSAYTLSARRRKMAQKLGMGKGLAAWRAGRTRRAG